MKNHLILFRYKVALKLIKRANNLLAKGDFQNVKKSLTYWKWSIAIAPPSEELREYKERLRKMVGEHQKKLESL